MFPCAMPTNAYSYYIHINIVIIIHTMDSQLGKFMADTAIVNTVLIHQFIFFLGIFHLSKKQIMDMLLVGRCAANGTPDRPCISLLCTYYIHGRLAMGLVHASRQFFFGTVQAICIMFFKHKPDTKPAPPAKCCEKQEL